MSSPAPKPIPLSMNTWYSKHDDTSGPKQDMMESSRISFFSSPQATAFPYPHGRPATLFVARCIDHPIPLSFIEVLFVAANGTMGVRGVVGPSLWNQINSIEWLQKSHKNLNLLLSLYLCLLSVEDKCGTSKCSWTSSQPRMTWIIWPYYYCCCRSCCCCSSYSYSYY